MIFEIHREDDMSPYNETDSAWGGGYFNCPNEKCCAQQYVHRTEIDDESSCTECQCVHKFVGGEY